MGLVDELDRAEKEIELLKATIDALGTRITELEQALATSLRYWKKEPNGIYTRMDELDRIEATLMQSASGKDALFAARNRW